MPTGDEDILWKWMFGMAVTATFLAVQGRIRLSYASSVDEQSAQLCFGPPEAGIQVLAGLHT